MEGGGRLEGLSVSELVERFRAGAEEACFAELYRRTRRRVFGIALRVLGDAASAEEVCHDAFVRAYQRFDSLRGPEFPAWVGRIAANLALNARRHRAVGERSTAERDDPPPVEGSERRLISRQELASAMEILTSLGPEQRRVFLLRHLEDLSYGQIGAATGFSGEQVRSHLQNARRNFAIRWRERGRAAGGNHD